VALADFPQLPPPRVPTTRPPITLAWYYGYDLTMCSIDSGQISSINGAWSNLVYLVGNLSVGDFVTGKS